MLLDVRAERSDICAIKMATTAKSQAKTRSEGRATGKRATPLLPFRPGPGGARPGAGRKPKISGRPRLDHRQRGNPDGQGHRQHLDNHGKHFHGVRWFNYGECGHSDDQGHC